MQIVAGVTKSELSILSTLSLAGFAGWCEST